MLEFLKRVCQLFDAHHFDYMLSGSLALNIYTLPRMTRDIDMVVALTESNLDSFLACFPLESAYYSYQAARDAVRLHGMFNIIDFESGFKLDVIVLKPDPYRQTEFKRRIRTELLGFSATIVSPEDLILSKLIWMQDLDSERQREDISLLVKLAELDWVYLKYWVAELHLKHFGDFTHG